MTSTAPQRQTMSASETRLVSIDFTNKLDSGESLTGTVTTTVSPTGPTISNAAVSSGALTINGATVAAGKAVQFKITGVTAATTYTVTASVATDSTPAETVTGAVVIKVDA